MSRNLKKTGVKDGCSAVEEEEEEEEEVGQ
jgi:hypothetical protein